MTSTFKWFLLGDLQIPYQDDRAVALALKVMKAWKPDAIDFVGDIDDQLEYSTFSDGTTDEFFNQIKVDEKEFEKAQSDYEKKLVKLRKDGDVDAYEALEPPSSPSSDPLPLIKAHADGAKEFYSTVRRQHKNADLHSSLGNHDIRIFKYIDKKAPDYIDQVTPNILWGLDDLGISWRHYDDPPLMRFAGIHVHHGVTTTSSGLSVKNDIEQYNISLVRGHDHRGGVVFKTYPMSNTSLVGMGTGHLCNPQAYGLHYTINPAWELGFGIGHIEGGNVHLQFIPISPDYTCVVDGKLFQG